MELHSPETKNFPKNDFHHLNSNSSLREKFRCQAAYTSLKHKYKVRNRTIASDFLKDNKAFHKVLGLINTDTDK